MALSAAEGAGTNQSGFNTPGQGRGLLEVFRWRYLLRLLVRKETSTRYRNSVLGWVWSYVRPAAQFIIFYLVMGVFLQMARGIENFAMYLFSGIIVINFFSEGFSNATRSLVDNAHLVRKIYMPRELFPVAAVIVSFVHFLPQAAVLLDNPRLTRADVVALLSPDGAQDAFRNLLGLLFDNRRLPLLPEIAGLFDELRFEAERVVRAKVTSAATLADAELETIKAALRKRFGREVEVETAIDESLIGGALIDAGDVVIDGSIKGKLTRLQSALSN